MRSLRFIVAMFLLAVSAAFVSGASAQTLQVLTVGSGAQFGPFAVAAYALAQAGGAKAYHYTLKSGGCPASDCFAEVDDVRGVDAEGTLHTVPFSPGNLWVVWSTNGIWAYLSAGSSVGVRAFNAVPRASLWLAPLDQLPISTTTSFPFWGDKTNDTFLTTAVYSALSGKQFTAANTDIRPEDALFATNQALNKLGYGAVPDPREGHSGQYLIGVPIESHWSPAGVIPASFTLPGGTDPFTGKTVPAETIIPVGAAPIVFIASAGTGSTVANASDITTANAAELFSGKGDYAASLVSGATGSIDPLLSDPLSGIMNTAQYTVFIPGGASQETGFPVPNPGTRTELQCGSGARFRMIDPDYDFMIGFFEYGNMLSYTLFSYEAVNTVGHSNSGLRYLKLNGIDPLFPATHTYTGELLVCPMVNDQFLCPQTFSTGLSFPNLRNGTYKAWSIYRVITDTNGEANAQKLVTEAQKLVDTSIPDFVPFVPVCATATSGLDDPGLDLYREHFVPSTIETIPNAVSITPNDGSRGETVTCRVIKAILPALTLGGGTEEGGDVGGIIEGPFTDTKLPTVPGPTEGQPH
jgi:hypothetical protein